MALALLIQAENTAQEPHPPTSSHTTPEVTSHGQRLALCITICVYLPLTASVSYSPRFSNDATSHQPDISLRFYSALQHQSHDRASTLLARTTQPEHNTTISTTTAKRIVSIVRPTRMFLTPYGFTARLKADLGRSLPSEA